MMSDFFSAYKELNPSAKELIVASIVLGSFWTVPFILFKPEFFLFPIYAQIALIFALTVIWHIVTMIVTMRLVDTYLDRNLSPIRVITIIAIIILNISILVSYYYSASFTYFLRYAYGTLGVYFLGQFIFFVIKDVRNADE